MELFLTGFLSTRLLEYVRIENDKNTIRTNKDFILPPKNIINFNNWGFNYFGENFVPELDGKNISSFDRRNILNDIVEKIPYQSALVDGITAR